MGNLKSCLVVATLALAACGSDHKANPDAPVVLIDAPVDTAPTVDAAPDAPAYDFSCMGNSAPSANAQVTISGTVDEIGFDFTTMMPTFTAISGATVDACTGNCNAGNALATATTDAQGAFTDGPIATSNSMPIDGYLKMTHTGDRTIYMYPASPIAMDVTMLPVMTFTPLVVSGLSQVGCTQQAGNGMVGILVTDCVGNRISNATVTVQQGGSNVGDTPIDAGAFASQAAGLYLVCNVPPNANTTVNATYMSTTFLPHVIASVAGATTETFVRPGY